MERKITENLADYLQQRISLSLLYENNLLSEEEYVKMENFFNQKYENVLKEVECEHEYN